MVPMYIPNNTKLDSPSQNPIIKKIFRTDRPESGRNNDNIIASKYGITSLIYSLLFPN